MDVATNCAGLVENSFFRRIPEAMIDLDLDPMASWMLTVIALKVHRFNNILIASNDQLVEWSGMSRGSVIKHIQSLEDAGLIVVLRRKRKTNRYSLAGMMAEFVCGDGPIDVQDLNANDDAESIEVQNLDVKEAVEVQNLDAKQEYNKQEQNMNDDDFVSNDLGEDSEMVKKREMLRKFGVRGAMVDKLAVYDAGLLRLKMGEARMSARTNPVGYLVRLLQDEPSAVVTPALFDPTPNVLRWRGDDVFANYKPKDYVSGKYADFIQS